MWGQEAEGGRRGGRNGGGAGARSKVFTSPPVCFLQVCDSSQSGTEIGEQEKSQLRKVLSMLAAMAKGGATYHSLLKKLPIFSRKQTREDNVTSSCLSSLQGVI